MERNHHRSAGCVTGGIRSLAGILIDEDLCGAVEADFQQFYGLPLAPGVAYTWRRFKVLLRELPQQSRFVRAQPVDDSPGPPDMSGWDNTDRLLALISDLLLLANWQRSGETKKPKLFFNQDTSDVSQGPVLSDSEVRDVLAKMAEGVTA